ncbi:MAG: Gfo/Idh/MocA family oxidoreductase [Candidatus Hydrogenedentes bacterium]|nr:Gfo/Idh/MocA family oxidoreductase [Candidatus Hydrogenedentota bacterium]
MQPTRRSFLRSTASAVLVGGMMATGRVFGANDRIPVAVIGLRGRGRRHLSVEESDPANRAGFNGRGTNDVGSDVVAVCDVDERVLEARLAQCKADFGKAPKVYRDMRDLFADGGVAAVSVATPNHWHALAAVWACQAGKDVFVEKPLSHTFWEGEQVVAAAKQYNRIVQHGTQSRAHVNWVRLMQRVRAGAIGEVYLARGLCFKGRGPIGFAENTEPPKQLNWDLWQGPADARPYCDNYVPYNWHWFWNYGNGDIGNQGVHQMDLAVWGLGVTELPVRVSSHGGRYGYEDQGETPNTQGAAFTYADGRTLEFAVRGLYTNDEGGQTVGNLLYGSRGFAAGDRLYRMPGNEIPDEGEAEEEILVDGNQYRAFLKAVRSRDEKYIAGTAAQGHLSCAHIHLANIAYRLQRSLNIDPKSGAILGDDEANALLTRPYRDAFTMPDLAV